MTIIICSGFNQSEANQSFIQGVNACILSFNQSLFSDSFSLVNSVNTLIFAEDNLLVLSSVDKVRLLTGLSSNPSDVAVLFIAFSAGVVGAIATAWEWQKLGGKVKAVIAIDGWGVPLAGNFPIHRLSHDYFTHWTSVCPLVESEHFYADPPVEHLQIWRSPHTTMGWYTSNGKREYMSAAEYIYMLLKRYEEVS